MTTLERIERERGYTHTVADWHAALQKGAADLTDLDVLLIEHFEGAEKAAAARARHAVALMPGAEPLVTKGHVARATVAAPASDDALIDAIEVAKFGVLTKAQVAVIEKGAPDLAQWARDKRAQARDAEASTAVTALGLDGQQLKGLSPEARLGTVVAAAIRKAQEEPAKRIAALEARVLELEAQAASRELVP